MRAQNPKIEAISTSLNVLAVDTQFASVRLSLIDRSVSTIIERVAELVGVQ